LGELRRDHSRSRFYSDVVIDNHVVPGEEHDDSPWRPGADVRFDHAPRRSFDDSKGGRDGERDGADAGMSSAGRSTLGTSQPGRGFNLLGRRGLAAALLLTIALGAAMVTERGGAAAPRGDLQTAAVRSDEDATGVHSSPLSDVGGDVTLGPGDVPLLTATTCPTQRLPSSADPRWDVELPDARRIITPVMVSEESVVAVVGFDEPAANGLPSVSVVALNVTDGQERWRAGLQPSTGQHEIVGVMDGAVIVRSAAGPDMAYRRLFAFDEDSGAVLWDRGFRGDWSATVDPATGLIYVRVRRPAVSAIDESEVEVRDPRTGDRLHIAGGAFVGLDPHGRVVTRIGDEVLATSRTDREVLGVVAPRDSPVTLLGSRVVVADGAVTEVSVFAGGDEAQRLPLVGSTGIDAPSFVAGLDSLGGSSLLVNSDGAVHGAQVGDDTIEIRWRVMGGVLESAATDRGRSLLIEADGGVAQRVIDSSTGRTIVDLERRSGTLTTLALVANGVVVQDDVDGELVRLALDLDGRELWSLPGSGPFAVGRGVVVDVDDSDAVVRVSAWGGPVVPQAEAGECRRVMTEWTPR